MRDQYAGDVTDAVKFSLLRRLAADDRSLGVGWYYDQGHDGTSDGDHVSWREDSSWASVDADVHRELRALSLRSVESLESTSFWPPRTTFHRTPVPGPGPGRYVWASELRERVADSDLVYLDPDNGVAYRPTKKHASFTEIRRLRRPERTLVIVRFPDRSATHQEQVARGQQLLVEETDAAAVATLQVTVRSGKRSRAVWFDLIDPDATTMGRLTEICDDIAALQGATASVISADVGKS
jgi:hypothetical protein